MSSLLPEPLTGYTGLAQTVSRLMPGVAPPMAPAMQGKEFGAPPEPFTLEPGVESLERAGDAAFMQSVYPDAISMSKIALPQEGLAEEDNGNQGPAKITVQVQSIFDPASTDSTADHRLPEVIPLPRPYELCFVQIPYGALSDDVRTLLGTDPRDDRTLPFDTRIYEEGPAMRPGVPPVVTVTSITGVNYLSAFLVTRKFTEIYTSGSNEAMMAYQLDVVHGDLLRAFASRFAPYGVVYSEAFSFGNTPTDLSASGYPYVYRDGENDRNNEVDGPRTMTLNASGETEMYNYMLNEAVTTGATLWLVWRYELLDQCNNTFEMLKSHLPGGGVGELYSRTIQLPISRAAAPGGPGTLPEYVEVYVPKVCVISMPGGMRPSTEFVMSRVRFPRLDVHTHLEYGPYCEVYGMAMQLGMVEHVRGKDNRVLVSPAKELTLKNEGRLYVRHNLADPERGLAPPSSMKHVLDCHGPLTKVLLMMRPPY